jgi:hypothetical protein
MDDGSTTTATSFASDSNTRSRNSQNTTATSFGEIGQLDDSCEPDLPPGITEEDARIIRDQHRHIDRDGEPDGPLMTGERGLREHQLRNRMRRGELGIFRNILDRMQRREEVPDEWWAAIGLTPDVVRGAQAHG